MGKYEEEKRGETREEFNGEFDEEDESPGIGRERRMNWMALSKLKMEIVLISNRGCRRALMLGMEIRSLKEVSTMITLKI